MIRVGIIGGSGYTGLELMRILLSHPEVEITAVTSRRFAGRRLGDVFPHLMHLTDLKFEDVSLESISNRADIVFTAVPHTRAMEYVPEILRRGCRVIDLSADYRLNTRVYERVYGVKHRDPGRRAVYGLCELHPDVRDADLVANPGCYPTGAILAAAPLVRAGVVDRVIFDAKSGISGAGAEPTNTSHFPNLAENIKPYRITTHRHHAEMTQELRELDPARIGFTPHVIPAIRGILTTAHILLRKPVEPDEVQAIFDGFYDDKPFVRVGGIPDLASVRGSNFCDIGFELEEGSDRLVVISAIDNLVKGASGQAVQNMNLMFGLDERMGLMVPGLFP
ncbi:MAG TPA: N-acetyl-gamma-glutamyl-phosphate reductase [Candidatus Syntrophoarchaeum butanivorans]|uniref:N-acetyl-gamma-glutamyl-phosphate reductase n=1 Tax=Candidatus Syntropharchaeum butanivorans TaxID=1839936 RepID=A0A7C0X134_9EURY|nr:N-acetyl-gamma-glutamyl-phosphate reductase [Candidatus Syntrophoarchaeum butanivorans]